MATGSLNDIIAALEELAADVEASVKNNPQNAGESIEGAFHRTNKLIQAAIPQKQQQNEWISQLNKICNDSKGDLIKVKDEDENALAHSDFTSVAQLTTNISERNSTPFNIQCNCPFELPTSKQPDAMLPSPKYVRCIYGCGLIFCSATCRKSCLRKHRPNCHALLQKDLLKKVGLHAPEELF